MDKAKKIFVPIIAILCVLAIVYLVFFFGKNALPISDLSTTGQKEYTITFDSPQIEYYANMDFMDGVKAVDKNGNDLTDFVTVSCKPSSDMYKKVLTYSINKSGYKICTFERELILDKSYKGPSIKVKNFSIEIPLDEAKNISTIVYNSGAISTDDGFGGSCSITAQIQNQDALDIGEYIANVTAQNIFGDTANAKITVTITAPKSSIIKLSTSSITIKRGESFDARSYIQSAYSEEYGDLIAFVNVDELDTSKAGIFTIEYTIKGIKELENEKAFLYVTVN